MTLATTIQNKAAATRDKGLALLCTGLTLTGTYGIGLYVSETTLDYAHSEKGLEQFGEIGTNVIHYGLIGTVWAVGLPASYYALRKLWK